MDSAEIWFRVDPHAGLNERCRHPTDLLICGHGREREYGAQEIHRRWQCVSNRKEGSGNLCDNHHRTKVVVFFCRWRQKVIDADGYRTNVGMVLCNRHFQVLWARRLHQNSWQFPQGGVNEGEEPQEAMFRELYEELGLGRDCVTVLAVSRMWLRYRLPRRMVHWDERPVCIGQKQKWFLLRLKDESGEQIEFDREGHPEFDGWRWVSYWYPVRQVVAFKRDVYRKVLTEFAPRALMA